LAATVQFVAPGPLSGIRQSAWQTNKLFEISGGAVSVMATLAVTAGFASHRRHNCCRGFATNSGFEVGID